MLCIFVVVFAVVVFFFSLFLREKIHDNMTTHGNLNQIIRGVIRRIDGWIGAISNRTVRYLPISGMKLLFFSNAF